MASENTVLGIEINSTFNQAGFASLGGYLQSIIGDEQNLQAASNTAFAEMMKATADWGAVVRGAADPAVFDAWLEELKLVDTGMLDIGTSFSRLNDASQTHLASMLKEEEALGQLTAKWQEYAATTGTAATATETEVKAGADEVTVLNDLGERLASLPVAFQEAVDVMVRGGVSMRNSITAAEEAMAEGVPAEELYAQGLAAIATETNQVTTSSEQKNTKLREQKVATQESDTAHINLFETMRGGRLMIAGLLADMALMNIAMGEQLPASTREAVKGIQTVIDTSVAMAFAFDAFGIASGGLGLAIGALVGVLEVLVTTAAAGDQSFADLNKSLDTLSKKDDTITTLANLASVTNTQAENAKKAAQSNADLGIAIETLAKQAEPASVTTALLDGFLKASGGDSKTFGDNVGYLANTISSLLLSALEGWLKALTALETAIQEIPGVVQGSISVQDAWTKAVTAGTVAGQAFEQEIKGTSAAQVAAADTLKNLIAGLPNLTTNLKQSADAAHSLSDELTSLGQREDALNLKKTEDAAAADLKHQQDATARLDAYLNDQAKIQRAYDEAVASDNQSLYDKESDQAFQYQQRLAELGIQQLERQQTLSNDLVRIAQNEQLAINRLTFDEGQKLRDAKTQHDAEKIMEAYVFDVAQTQAKANNERNTDEARYTQEVRFQDMRRKLIDEEYAHELMVDQRTHDEELAKAKQTETDRLADIKFTYDQAVTAADNRYTAETTAMQHRYDAEKLAIDNAIAKAKEDYTFKMKWLTDENNMVTALAQNYLILAQREIAAMSMSPHQVGGQSVMPGGGWGFQHGGSFVVPPGFPNDSFAARFSSGEKVHVDNRSGSTGAGNNTYNFYITGGDPHAIAEEVRRVLDTEAFR